MTVKCNSDENWIKVLTCHVFCYLRFFVTWSFSEHRFCCDTLKIRFTNVQQTVYYVLDNVTAIIYQKTKSQKPDFFKTKTLFLTKMQIVKILPKAQKKIEVEFTKRTAEIQWTKSGWCHAEWCQRWGWTRHSRPGRSVQLWAQDWWSRYLLGSHEMSPARCRCGVLRQSAGRN